MSSNMNIFGSPPPKLFEISKEIFNPSAWVQHKNEWLKVLLKENEKLKNEAHPESGLAFSEAASCIFLASRKLNLPTNVKYLALDIYHRFCLLHIENLTQYVRKEEMKGEFNVSIKNVQKKVGEQSPLRVLSCLRIASKLTCHKKVMTGECVQNLLEVVGSKFSLKAVNRSEIRILEQLNFRCGYASTFLEYVGVLVAQISTDELVGVQVDHLHRTAVQLLDFTCLNYNKVFHDLFFAVMGSRIIRLKHKPVFARVLCDRMLFSTGIIGAAGFIIGGDTLSASIIKKLSTVAKVPEEDILALSARIIDQVMGDTEI